MGDKINKICYHVMDDESKCSSIDLTVAGQKKNETRKGKETCPANNTWPNILKDTNNVYQYYKCYQCNTWQTLYYIMHFFIEPHNGSLSCFEYIYVGKQPYIQKPYILQKLWFKNVFN